MDVTSNSASVNYQYIFPFREDQLFNEGAYGKIYLRDGKIYKEIMIDHTYFIIDNLLRGMYEYEMTKRMYQKFPENVLKPGAIYFNNSRIVFEEEKLEPTPKVWTEEFYNSVHDLLDRFHKAGFIHGDAQNLNVMLRGSGIGGGEAGGGGSGIGGGGGGPVLIDFANTYAPEKEDMDGQLFDHLRLALTVYIRTKPGYPWILSKLQEYLKLYPEWAEVSDFEKLSNLYDILKDRVCAKTLTKHFLFFCYSPSGARRYFAFNPTLNLSYLDYVYLTDRSHLEQFASPEDLKIFDSYREEITTLVVNYRRELKNRLTKKIIKSGISEKTLETVGDLFENLYGVSKLLAIFYYRSFLVSKRAEARVKLLGATSTAFPSVSPATSPSSAALTLCINEKIVSRVAYHLTQRFIHGLPTEYPYISGVSRNDLQIVESEMIRFFPD